MEGHPFDLLADAVGGTLSAADRAALDAHLATCSECREELESAREAVGALTVVRDAEVSVPLGVTAPVLREARNQIAARRARPARWAMGVAAAAIVVGVAVVAMPGGSDGAGGGAAAKVETAAAPATGTFEAGGGGEANDAAMPDATDESLQNLADVAAQAPAPNPPIDYSGPQLDCLVSELDPEFLEDQIPIQIVSARYEGVDALVGTFILEEAAQRLATVRVADAATCVGMATFFGFSD